jgi:hypothetical protein
MIFKKNKSSLFADNLKYFPQRDVRKEPITKSDLIQINAFPENNAGKDYMKQHLHFINTMVSREFVYTLTEKMLDEAVLVKDKFNPENLSAEQIAVWLTHGYCFAMTESLFEIARKGLISSACKDAISEMAMLSQMEVKGNTELVLHCLYRGFEVSRINVPVEND